MLRRTNRQNGFALLVLVVLLGLAAIFVVVDRLNAAAVLREYSQTDRVVLTQAKEALVGYAATYRDTHSSVPPPVFGYLPCPASDGNGIAASSCGSGASAAIGFLPFRTLNLPDLRDSAGECLWYAVSGRVKNSPAQLPLNWDVQGQFTITKGAATGPVLATPNPLDGGPIAVVIAPGRSLSGQVRTTADSVCGKAPTYSSFVDGNPTFPNTADVTLIEGMPFGAAINDRLVWISAKEVFDPISRRTDLVAQINGLIAEITSCLAFGLPAPAAPANSFGGNSFGMVPSIPTSGSASFCPYGSVSADYIHYWRNWREIFRYMRCSGSAACASVNGFPCRGALLFGGQRTSTQRRASASDKADASNYLEGANATSWTTGGMTFAGSSSYSQSSPSQDVAICLN